jgi:hypothetical protein
MEGVTCDWSAVSQPQAVNAGYLEHMSRHWHPVETLKDSAERLFNRYVGNCCAASKVVSSPLR